MIKLKRTNSGDYDFLGLIRLLDADLAIREGKGHTYYSQFNKLDKIKYLVVAYDEDEPVGCGAIKEYDKSTMEVKRIFTLPERRGNGIATKVLIELEMWAKELHFTKCILETGKRRRHD